MLRQNPVTFGLILTNVVVFMISWVMGADPIMPEDGRTLLTMGANFAPYSLSDAPWRLFSAAFLHYGLIHLVVNMFVLYRMGPEVEKIAGHTRFLIIYLSAAVMGSLASAGWHLFVVGVGASGAVFGLYGFSVAYQLLNGRSFGEMFDALIGLSIFLAINIMIGLWVNADQAAHFGGLLWGGLMGLLCYYASKNWQLTASLALLGVLVPLITFAILPRDQLRHYRAFQQILQAEQRSSELVFGETLTDNAYLDSLQQAFDVWDKVLTTMRGLEVKPQELRAVQKMLTQYSELKQVDVAFRQRSIEVESYIYWDSIEYALELIDTLPPLNFMLNYENTSPVDSVAEPEEATAALVPMLEFYDSNWQAIRDRAQAVYYRKGQQDSLRRWQGKVFDFYADGAIQMKGTYKDGLKNGVFLYYHHDSTYSAAGKYEMELKTGKWEYFGANNQKERKLMHSDRTYTLKVWDDGGQLMVDDGQGMEHKLYSSGATALKGAYADGRKTGLWIGEHPDGSQYFEELYEDGFLVRGISFDTKSNSFTYDESVGYPNPEVGFPTYQAYINQQKRYPTEARQADVSGNVSMIFTVTAEGYVQDIRFLKSLGHGCDQEAERLLLDGPKWRPALEYGQIPYTTETVLGVSFP